MITRTVRIQLMVFLLITVVGIAFVGARYAQVDRLFVEMMSAHHEGAIKMARDVLAVYRNARVEELATAIATEQGIEIDRMRDALSAPR